MNSEAPKDQGIIATHDLDFTAGDIVYVNGQRFTIVDVQTESFDGDETETGSQCDS